MGGGTGQGPHLDLLTYFSEGAWQRAAVVLQHNEDVRATAASRLLPEPQVRQGAAHIAEREVPGREQPPAKGIVRAAAATALCNSALC